jgi:hypothetical protein
LRAARTELGGRAAGAALDPAAQEEDRGGALDGVGGDLQGLRRGLAGDQPDQQERGADQERAAHRDHGRGEEEEV